jgi:K+-sensing histidine kinase KdpD
MEKTILEIPTELLEAAKITAEEAKTELAIRLYQQHKLNEDQARQLAGDPKVIEELVWCNNTTGRIDLDDFLSWASHDLKSPLNTIIGFTRVVIKGIDGPINENQSADLTTAFISSQRMLFFLNNLVDMARLNIGHITLRRAEVDLTGLIKESCDKWQIANPAKKLTYDINISKPVFSVDGIYLRNIVSSLLSYAAIRITDGVLSLTARDDQDGLHVNIQSAGKKSLDKFELDSAMFDFVCASLIKLHGGKMETPQDTEDGLLLAFSLPR